MSCPEMLKLASDRLETVDLRSGATRVWSQEELLQLTRSRKT